MRLQRTHCSLMLFLLSALLALGACSPKPELATPTTTAAPVRGGASEIVSRCESTQVWAKGFQPDQCLMADNALPPITPIFWPDVCESAATMGWTPSQSSFDQLSWRNFLYAVWPADPGKPGTPDTRQPIGAMQGGAFLPTVWESFKSEEDLFNPGGQIPAGCSAGGPRILTMTSKVPTAAFHAVAAAGHLSSIDQAFSGPLVDQNGKLVYYEIRVNEVESSYILKAGAQKKSPYELNCTGKPTDCTPFELPLGSMEVKAAWKQLSDKEVKSGRFYSQPFQLQKPNGQCPTVTMGLVGLHIIHKTQLSANQPHTPVYARYPSWAWSTFEHVDNVPPAGSSRFDGTYSFFNPSCSPQVSAAVCAQMAESRDRSAPEYRCCDNLDRYGRGILPVDPTPNQITRLDNPPAETQSCNAVYAKTKRGIWDNYSLVTTQWPKKGDGGQCPVVTPPHVRSAVIESYFTKWDNCGKLKQVNASSCMGCHSGSQAVDMSYLFLRNAAN